jgi:glycosyltransferase involved in cell wall biosynthesis
LTDYAIILAAYEGGAYLDAQIESIRGQSAAGWRLYARDDGSRDDTRQRLDGWAARDPRIEVLPSGGARLGAAASFGLLLQHALDRGARYVFPSDQDDVWLPRKCERMLALMHGREAILGTEAPLLVHSDLTVVDRDLAPIHPSFAAQHRLNAGAHGGAARLLLGNSVTGCAALVNAPLVRCALPMPEVAMHDWWLAQCAAVFGEVAYLDEPTVLYRQHGGNVVGARGMSGRAAAIARSPRAWWRDSAARFLKGLHQVWTLRLRARNRGLATARDVGESVEILWTGLAAGTAGLPSRLSAARRSGALPHAFALRILALARVALLPLLRARFGDERDRVTP